MQTPNVLDILGKHNNAYIKKSHTYQRNNYTGD